LASNIEPRAARNTLVAEEGLYALGASLVLVISLMRIFDVTEARLAGTSQFRSEASQTDIDKRRATEGPQACSCSPSRSPRERNAGDMPGSAAAVESW
jgi:hypothetical protein